METKPIINVVGTQCSPEDEEKFNTWYNEVHIPLILKFKGIKKATRYKITAETGDYPKYLAIYEFKSQESYKAYGTSPELAAVREEMKQSWKEGEFEVKWLVQYEVTKTWER